MVFDTTYILFYVLQSHFPIIMHPAVYLKNVVLNMKEHLEAMQ